jgi:hypothetical protein
MSFMNNAMSVLDRAETSLHEVVADALAAKAYEEIAIIAAMAEAVGAINVGRSGGERRITASVPDLGIVSSLSADDTTKAAEPSWMRPKT